MPRIRRNVRLLPVLLLALTTAGLFVHAAPDQEVATWAALGAVADARSGAASVALKDGRTLIIGGVVDGLPADSVVVYDPLANTFTSVGQLLAARVGHTATLLGDDRILVVGGTTGGLISADIEVFDPASGGSTLVALLAQPRTGHGAARLQDGTVLIVGGTTVENVVLASAELFDPVAGSTTVVSPSLQQPRTGASATTLIDGRVLVAGGSDGTNDLSSAEVFEAVSQTFTLASTALSVARNGHTAVLLPYNNSVLITGGSSGGAPQTASDLFLPALFPDPYSWGMGTFVATASMAAARNGAVGGSTAEEGLAFAVGGGPADAEVYRFPTIKTDKDDFAPGEPAVITGTGWQPGEAVKLVFQEDPAVHEDYVIDRNENGDAKIVADANGNIFWDQWSPEEHDLGVRFYLMATGQESGRRAQVTFTDDRTAINQVNIVTAQSPASVPAGNAATYVIGVDFNTQGGPGNNSCTVQMSTQTGPGQTGLPATDSVSFSAPSITSINGSDHQTTLTIDTASGISAGTYTFTIFATGTGGSGNDCSTSDSKKQNASLVVGAPADNTKPDVTVNQAATQADPTTSQPINFTVVFSEAINVATFTGADVSLGGTAGNLAGATKVISPVVDNTYNIAVSGLTTDGTVTASIAAGGVEDLAGNTNNASTSSDNEVTLDGTKPNVSVNQAATQADPTTTQPINFTAVFTEAIKAATFTDADVILVGTAGNLTATRVITLVSGNTYNIAVSGLTSDGTVTAAIDAGGVEDLAGNTNNASTSSDNEVTLDSTKPNVTVNQAATQVDPTNTLPINFTAAFTEAINAATFTDADVTLGGTAGNLAGATKVITLVSGNTYNIAVSGLTSDGTVTAAITAGAVEDLAGNTNNASTSTDNEITLDRTKPNVTVNQAGTQADPTNTLPINFTAVFSEAIKAATFTDADVTLGGTAGNLAATKVITLVSGNTYNIAVSGLTSSGTVTASINAGAVEDLAGNTNNASTSTDNQVVYDKDPPESLISFPVTGSLYNATLWIAGCSTAAVNDMCGTASDTGGSGLKEVKVSILGPNGMYWDGSAFNSVTATYILATGASTWSFAFNPATAGSYTVHARAEDNAGNLQSPVASASFTINAPPLVTNNGPKTTTEYSDPIDAVTISASDDGLPVALSGPGLTIASTDWKLCTLALCADAYTHPGTLPSSLTLNAVSDGSEISRQWTLSGVWNLPAGKYLIKVCVSDGLDAGCTEVEINIDEEDVILDYIGDIAKAIPPPGGSVTLRMNAAVNEESDGYPGDKLKPETRVKFELFPASGPAVGDCTIVTNSLVVVGPGVATTAPTGCDITIYSVTEAATYEVRMSLIDAGPDVYYESPGGTGSVNVDIAAPGHSSAGVWFYDPTVDVTTAAAQNRKVNIGLTASYVDLKKRSGARGNLVMVWRANIDLSTISPLFPAGGSDYNIIVKATSTTAAGSSLYLQECDSLTPKTCWFAFGGKANVKAINRQTGVATDLGALLGGGTSFQVDGRDASEPGSTPGAGPDGIAIRVWSAGGNMVVFDGNMASPNYEGDKDSTPGNPSRVQIAIQGGNAQVHK